MESVKKHRIGDGPFVIPDFPDHVTIKSTPPKDMREFLEPLLTAALKSNGFIINNFAELDGEEYLRHYEKTTGTKAWHLGPASLVGEPRWRKQRGQKSVLYEIACGMEASGYEFIWVVPREEREGRESEEEKEKWLPKGFEERKKGMIIKGGPHSAGYGVEVGAEEWNLSAYFQTQKLLPRDRIEMAVRTLMDVSDQALQIRRQAQNFSRIARQAVQVAGSSYNNLTALIHYVKRFRDSAEG
ncbi:hypothetical protein JHK86_019851 [Glycine max]|nr:hypothetical protein JHK86_019851 [Glycine max]